MSAAEPIRLLLGPQRPDLYLDRAVQRAGLGGGTIAVISAAWQEAEGDIAQIRGLAGAPVRDLRLYQRTDELFAADASLREAYRARQDQLIEQQRMYRLRLRQLAIAAREILCVEGDRAAIAAERRHAISQLRALDRHHLRQIRRINAPFDAEFGPGQGSPVDAMIAAIERDLEGCDTVLITGGNVIVLINRLRLFGLGPQLRARNIIAWSAGAMALTDRIVLFHDRMPQGRRDPEVMSEGLGLVNGTVLLPDARSRLRLKDTTRSSLISRRFSPATCLTLDNGAMLLMTGDRIRECEQVRHVSRNGRFRSVRAA